MNLSVIHRITGGYLIILICLVAIGLAGFSSITSINSGLDEITSKANPVSDLTAEINTELTSANLTMYQHFNSSDDKLLKQYNTRFIEFRKTYLSLSKSLSEGLSQVEGSSEEIKRLNALEKSAPETFDAIEQLMRLHTRSFTAYKNILSIKKEALSTQVEITQLFNDAKKRQLPEQELVLLNNIHLLVNDGISVVNQLVLTKELSDLIKLRDTFGAWLESYIQVGFQIQSSIKEGLESSDILEKKGILISKLNIIVISQGGLIESLNSYLVDRSLLAKNLQANEKKLVDLRSKFAHIREFVSGYSKQVKQKAGVTVDEGQTMILSISLFAILAGIIVTVLVVRSIKRPLSHIISVLQEMAKGNLSQLIKITQKDEFGQLQKSANTLNTNLKEMITAIQDQSHFIMDSVNKTQTITENTQVIVVDQKQQTEMVAAAMHEMTATTQEIAHSAEDTINKMLEAHQQAESSQQQITSNQEKTQELQDEMNNACEVINQLDTDVHNIEEIIQVIESIADQTNLLALNAAIEAARAGEQGRGFAVVADEVRTLAGRTRSSTEEIKSSIDTLLKGSKQAVNAIEGSQQTTVSSAEMATVIHQQVGDIVDKIATLKDLNMQVAAAAEQQSVTTEEVSRNIICIAGLSEDTAQGAENSLTQVKDLQRSAKDMEALVEKFKL